MRKAKSEAPGTHKTGSGKTSIVTTMNTPLGRKGRKMTRKASGR